MTRSHSPAALLVGAVLALAAPLASPPAAAQVAGPIDCELRFQLSGWSAFYKRADGTGTVTCDNGQRMAVRIKTRGGGITVGRTKITDGRGEFSGVHRIDDVLGSYAAAEAHAGAGRSAGAQALTKGSVSLAVAGKGEGWDLGVSFGKFVIER